MDSPIVTATIRAAALSAISSTIAQSLQCWQANKPWSIDLIEVFHFSFFAVLSCPPNFIWQSWLEAQFPGYAKSLAPAEKEALVDEFVAGQSTSVDEKSGGHAANQRRTNNQSLKDKTVSTDSRTSPKKKLSVKNTAIKFALDNTFGAFVNNLMVIVGLSLLRNQSLQQIRTNIDEQFWTMIFAGQKVWPAVSILNFVFIPVELRTTLASIVGIFWGIYVSIVTSQRN